MAIGEEFKVGQRVYVTLSHSRFAWHGAQQNEPCIVVEVRKRYGVSDTGIPKLIEYRVLFMNGRTVSLSNTVLTATKPDLPMR